MSRACAYNINFFLRPPFFNIVKILVKIMLKKTKGREAVFTASTPDEFVHTYDGNNTPIAKLYTRKEADMLFSRFETLKVSPHYFPIRFLRGFKSVCLMHTILDRYCGVLIYYLLRKPE